MRKLVCFLLFLAFACNKPKDYTDPKNRDLCGYSYSEIRQAELTVEYILRNNRSGAIHGTCLIADYDGNGVCDYVITLHGFDFKINDPATDTGLACMIAFEATAIASSKTKWVSDKAVLCTSGGVCPMYAYTRDLRICWWKYQNYQYTLNQYMRCIYNSIGNF